jgi:hypothetical protein
VYGIPYIWIFDVGIVADENVGSFQSAAIIESQSNVTVTVEYITEDGSALGNMDYVPASGSIQIVPGEFYAPITMTLIDDEVIGEDIETFNMELFNPTNTTLGVPYSTNVYIVDNDLPYIKLGEEVIEIGENVGSTQAVIALENSSEMTVTVDYETYAGSAIGNIDYIPISGTVQLAPGQFSQSLNITILDDVVPGEKVKSFTLELSNPLNALLDFPSYSTINIVDDDIYQSFLPTILSSPISTMQSYTTYYAHRQER